MKRKGFFGQERGSVAVIVAISLSALLGISAMALDFGRMASCRQSLQNAADAAALAVAADLGRQKSAQAEQTLSDYCRLNGFDPADETVSVSMDCRGKTVTVTVKKTLSMGFSAVLTGQNTRQVLAEATAEAVSIFGDCPYAMFAGQKIEDDGSGISITGNNITINGNIHSNSDITMRHAVLGNGAIATAVRNTVPSTAGWNANSIALDMPSFRSFESALKGMHPAVVEFGGNVTKNSKSGFEELLSEALDRYREQMGFDNSYLYEGLYIHISGNLTFNGHNSANYTPSFPIVLIVDGNIDLNGASLNSTRDYPVAVMSKNGNITVNGGGATYTGILYAPKGDITLNGNDAAFVGMIVGQNIRKSGGKITVSYYEDADKYLPPTKVHLIN